MLVRTEVAMNTFVTIRVLATETPEVSDAVNRAFAWFHEIERRCSRFDPESELMRITARPDETAAASPILFEAIQFALKVAEVSEGAFDPTVGRRMQARGFDREHRTGQVVRQPADACASWRDVELDAARGTIRLLRPLTLDLGAVAKGLAVDTAVRELEPLRDFVIDAGGDVYAGGKNERGGRWSVGIRHPRDDDEMIAWLAVSNQAVCSSGDYERPGHVLDPRTGASAEGVASATVIAPGAMLADAMATAIFVLGPAEGIGLLERLGLEGLIVTPGLRQYETRGLPRAA